MKIVLEDPTREELRNAFATLAPGDEIEFRRYSRNRAYSWARRYGWQVSTRQTTQRRRWKSVLPPSQDFVMVIEEKLPPHLVGKGVRQRLDDIVSGGAVEIELDEREAFETVFNTLGVKRFELRAIEGGEVWVQRLPDAE